MSLFLLHVFSNILTNRRRNSKSRAKTCNPGLLTSGGRSGVFQFDVDGVLESVVHHERRPHRDHLARAALERHVEHDAHRSLLRELREQQSEQVNLSPPK